MRTRRLLCTACLILLASFAGTGSAPACPACQDQVNSSADTLDIKGGASGGKGLTSLESGYSWSVLFLIAMPFGILGCLGFVIHKEWRKIEASAANHPSSPQKI